MRNSGRQIVGVCAALTLGIFAVSRWAWAQSATNPPFFNSAATAYEAQIATGDNGVLLSAKPIVSANLKYVTVGTQATNTGLATLTPFNLVIPANGTVGATASTPSAATPTGGTAPGVVVGQPAHAPSILDKPGMTLIAPLPG
jgi:hypothetical protein